MYMYSEGYGTCFVCVYMYMEIHVHSTLAKEYKGRKVIPTQTNKGTHTCIYITHKKLKFSSTCIIIVIHLCTTLAAYIRLHVVTNGYTRWLRRLQIVTLSYRRLWRVRLGYRWLRRITGA